MRLKMVIATIFAVAALPLAAAAQENSSALRLSWKASSVECQLVNTSNQTQTVTMSVHDQTGTQRATQTFTLAPLEVAQLVTSAFTIGAGNSVLCRISQDIGEISLCLWQSLFDPFVCITND